MITEEDKNLKSEKLFLSNLLPVAKELEKITRSREFRKEFENEMQNQETCTKLIKTECLSEQQDENECLKMEVYDDKDYDIEEIKFWNFISKNKGSKPSIIRTIVYKCPESSYIVKKIPVIINEPEIKLEEKKPEDIKDVQETEKVAKSIQQANNIINIKNSKKLDKTNTNIKTTNSLNDKPQTNSNIISKKTINSNNKSSENQNGNNANKSYKSETIKYSSEDVILIDEDDDIIGFDDDEEENENIEKKIDEEIEIEDEDEIEDENDDDIIEEEYIENTKNSDKFKNYKRKITHSDDEDADFDDENDETISKRNQNITNRINKKHKTKNTNPGRPKVVIEKAMEPISSISVKKTTDSNTKMSTRSKAVNLNKTLPILNGKTTNKKNFSNKKKLDQSIDSIVSVSSSSSSSTMSTLSTSILNNNPNPSKEQSRVTRSKAKLIETNSNK